MEKSVTLRFYTVRRTVENRPQFVDVLRAIAEKSLNDRERNVGPEDALVRLENFEEDEGAVFGQLIRGQSGNRPGQMLPEGTGNLPFTEPLGHGIAFRYRLRDGLLAIQFDTKILSPSRMMDYLYQHNGQAEFRLRPVLRSDAWERFAALPLRKLEVAVAGHPNASDLDSQHESVWQNIATMKEAYGADMVRFQISMGHRRGSLRDGAKDVLREAFRRHQNGEDDIRTIKGILETGDGIPNDEIDLMGTLFDVKEIFHFDENDFPRFYTLRRDLLGTILRSLPEHS